MKNCIRCHKQIANDAKFCPYCGNKQEPKHYRRPNGSGSAYKRGNVWELQVYVNGQKRRKSGFRTKSEALAYSQTLISENPIKVTFADMYELLTDTTLQYKNRDLQNKYRTAFERCSRISRKNMADIAFSDLQAIVTLLTYDQGKYVKTLATKIYDLAILQNLVSNNLGAQLKLPPCKPKETEPFTMDEVSAMWTAWENGNQFVGYILLMIYSGMMPAELLSVTKNMIDFEARTITGAGKKTEKRKKTPIVFASCVIPILEELTSGTDLLLYPYSESTFRDSFDKTLEELNIRPLKP